METACHELGIAVDTLPLTGLATTWQDYTLIGSLRQTVRCLGTRDLTELQGRLSGNAYLTFRCCFTDRLLSRLKVRIRLSPPPSPQCRRSPM
jgi:hypothetical protein